MSGSRPPSAGIRDAGNVSSPSDVDFFRSDSTLEDMEVEPQVSSTAPRQHVFDPEGQWNPMSDQLMNRPRPKQPGQPSSGSQSHKLNPGLTSPSWVAPLSSPSTNSFSGQSLRSGSRHAFVQEDDVPVKKPKTKKAVIIAGVAGVTVALATIIALIVVFGVKSDSSGDESASSDAGMTGTTKAPTIVIEDPVIIIDIGTWGNWSAYSSCPVTCGGGYNTRVRECLEEPCVGVSSQSQSCNDDRCPPDAIYGTWTTWTTWYGCSKTCGTGTEFRDRECEKESEDDEDCVGDGYHKRNCNEFDCPDCSKTCENGTLSPDCTHCECGENLNARVHSGGILLSGVTISPIETPTAAIAESGSDGMLNLTNQCLGVDYIVQKEDYISVEISTSNLGQGSIKLIELIELVPLSITRQPQDRMRLVGESVTLCCETAGNPEALDYEWLRDGNIVATTSGGSSSTLVFESLTMADAGYYNCRANNDYGAILSSEAHINVKESADQFCSSTPQSSVIELPDGCLFDGSSYFDVGECTPLACRGGDADNGTCADDQDNAYCCGPVTYSVIEVVCEDDDGDFSLPINMAKDCGCVLCPEVSLSVSGIAYGNETTLQLGEIINNGSVIAQTTQNGTFEFNVAIGTERMSLLFKDPVNRILLDTVYVVDFPRGAEGMYYITVLMLSKALTVEIDSTSETPIELPSVSNSSEPIATVTIPANSFVDANGNPYEGSVSASIGIIDPEDLTSLESAPGNFEAVGDNGESQQLESSGMMSFEFTDADGNPLAVSASIDIEVPTEDGNIKLWSLDPLTGNWIESGSLTSSSKKSTDSTTKLNGIKYEMTWYNFDSIRDAACYSKVKVYANDDWYENEQVEGVSVAVIVKKKLRGKKRGTNSLSRVRPSTDRNDKNGYCIIHPCESYRGVSDYEYEGWVMAHVDGNSLTPVNLTEHPDWSDNGLGHDAINSYGITSDRNKYHAETISLESADTFGPFYDWGSEGSYKNWRDSPKCSQAASTNRHFRFSANICYKEFDTIAYTTKAKDECLDHYYLLWNSLPSLEIFSKPHRIAFIKVYTPGMWDVKVSTKTSVRNQRTSSDIGKRNTVIGTRLDCIDNHYQMVCLEFKPPSEIGCSQSETVSETEVILSVRVRGGYKVSRVNSLLYDNYGNGIKNGAGTASFRAYIGDQDYGPEYGIYIAEHTDKDIAKRLAKRMCLAGTDDIESNTQITSDNWAVEFNDCKEQTNIIIAIGNIGAHFSVATMGRVKKLVKAIAAGVEVSTDVRIALIDSMYEINNQDTVIWDLNSNTSMSADIESELEAAIHEEWYEMDSYYNYYYYGDNCYGGYKSNGSAVHHVKRVFEDADNADAQNVVIFIGDRFDYDWCYYYDDRDIAAIGNELKKETRMISVQSPNYHRSNWWHTYYGFDFATSSADRFIFNETEAIVSRLNTYGCLFDTE